jgi:hypothetical protein
MLPCPYLYPYVVADSNKKLRAITRIKIAINKGLIMFLVPIK